MMKASNLSGLEIIDSDARSVGSVNDLEIDVKSWMVTGLIIKTGLLKKTSISIQDIDKIGDKVVLKVPFAKIQ